MQLTTSGTIVGTPSYMAPEQSRGLKVNVRTDLFSLGVVLYRMTTGQLPFKGKDAVSQLLALATDSPTHPSLINSDIPDELAELIMRLLEKDPKNRPPSAHVVADALQALEAGHGAGKKGRASVASAVSSTVDSTASFTLPAADAPVRQPEKKRSRAMPFVAAALLLLGGGGYLYYQVVIIRDKDGDKIAELKVPKDGKIEILPDSKGPAPSSTGGYALQFDGEASVWIGSLNLGGVSQATLEGYITAAAEFKRRPLFSRRRAFESWLSRPGFPCLDLEQHRKNIHRGREVAQQGQAESRRRRLVRQAIVPFPGWTTGGHQRNRRSTIGKKRPAVFSGKILRRQHRRGPYLQGRPL